MSAPLPPGSTIGIIGGGQLGRMLAMAAARLSYRVIVLEPQADCPAAQVANDQIVAPYDDPKAIAGLAARCDVVTYEFENVPVKAAERLAELVPLYPPARALEVAQDRVTEKTFLNSIGAPTARFFAIDDDAALAAGLEAFGGNGVLKTRRMGYDGKGQRVFRNASAADAVGVWDEMGGVPLILEELVSFEREISIITARFKDGWNASYDPAENVHRNGILHTSTTPAAISKDTHTEAWIVATDITSELGYVGVVGVEFFVLADGGLLVNEIAPRVHNSGHWTEAVCATSQFEQHIRAIVGLPFGSVERRSDCVMENLIGDDIARVPTLAAENNVVLHLYGKAEARSGRKMGHFTRLLPLS